jgi:hypothetical protein
MSHASLWLDLSLILSCVITRPWTHEHTALLPAEPQITFVQQSFTLRRLEIVVSSSHITDHHSLQYTCTPTSPLLPTMPQARPKPSEIAAEAKRVWMPYIWKNYIRDSKTSYLYPDATQIRINLDKRSSQRTRVAVMEGDPVTYALGWYQSIANADPDCKRIPVINVANEKRAGGDWESGLMAPEECFARRSNLVHALTMPWNAQLGREENFYPIPQKGGIYSPQVCKQQRPSPPYICIA